jgi:hypothetical protein
MQEDMIPTYRYYVPFYFLRKHSVENWSDYWIVEIVVSNPCQLTLVCGLYAYLHFIAVPVGNKTSMLFVQHTFVE